MKQMYWLLAQVQSTQGLLQAAYCLWCTPVHMCGTAYACLHPIFICNNGHGVGHFVIQFDMLRYIIDVLFPGIGGLSCAALLAKYGIKVGGP